MTKNPEKQTKENISAKLRELRKNRGLTINMLAEKMGEDHQKVARVERGERVITLDYLKKFSQALHAPIESIIHGEKKEALKKEKPSFLREIVNFFEELNSPSLKAKQKTDLIPKIYEQMLTFPENVQEKFLTALFDILKLSFSELKDDSERDRNFK